ncbi:MAG: histidine--tRNA ligase [Deltaproteobacteria bacterium]|nr:histidine--tRNA ligase [Deltaproteobacteria bacterium]MDQ3298561.1 histidine--tRNA ligase [Myxococcota bacterium]
MPVQPRTPPGVLELLPPQQLAFQRMLDTIRRGFERFGFLPVETPVFELTDVLLTKSGGETEKQVYFVQSTGALKQAQAAPAGSDKPPELALRFDLTVPLARYVAEHEHQLNFPFRRYQIQRVYRGERAQKGRYREFYQCDIDVIGKDTLALAYDAEVPAVIDGIFAELGFGKFTIRVNNRKLLRGLLESLGIDEPRHAAVLHEVDRLGKQARPEIEARLAGDGVGLEPAVATRLLDLLSAHAGDSRAALAALREVANPTEALTGGLAELQRVYEGTLALGVPESRFQIDLSIARGLDYYTGTVYETFLDDHPRLGSICSGGRYENLAGHYTKSKLPGVGISIGATRLFSQLLEMKVIDETTVAISDVLVLQVEPTLAATYAELATELRRAGLNVEVYGGEDKLAKQFKYADRAKVPLAVICGSRERDAGIVKVKDLRSATEHDVPRAGLVTRVRELLARPATPAT